VEDMTLRADAGARAAGSGVDARVRNIKEALMGFQV